MHSFNYLHFNIFNTVAFRRYELERQKVMDDLKSLSIHLDISITREILIDEQLTLSLLLIL